MISQFTFHADFGAGEVQLYPANDDLIFLEDKDQDFGFYRRKLQTTLVFKGEDFETLYSLELSGNCQNHDLEIRYKGDPYYTGIIKYRTQNMYWDLDKCRVDVRIEPKDDYTCLVEGWDTDFNILDDEIKISVKALGGEYQRNGCEEYPGAIEYTNYLSGCLSGDGWTVILHEATMDDTATFYYVRTEWAREVITVPCIEGVPAAPVGDNWTISENNCPVDAVYTRPVQTEVIEILDMGGPTLVANQVFYRESYNPIGTSLGSFLEYSNGVLMTSVLQQFNPCLDLKVRSNVLDLDPVGENPDTIPYTEPRTHHLVVFQKSDIRRPDAYEEATFETWTYLDVLRYLKAAFDIEPRVLADEGVLQLEHTTYWEKDEGLDLTELPYSHYIAGQSKYTYDTAGIARKETWKYYESTSKKFAGGPIYYDCFAGEDLDEFVTLFERVNSDVPFIFVNPDQIENDGFVVMETALNGADRYAVSRYIYPTTSAPYLNGGMAVSNLIDHFHRWNRPAIEGTMLDNPEIFETAIRRKKQVRLEFKLSAEDFLALNADNLMRSQLGWGQVQSITWSAKTCTAAVELMHN